MSEAKHISPIAKRTVLSDDMMSVLVPILEGVLGWEPPRIHAYMESQGFFIQEWDRVRTD